MTILKRKLTLLTNIRWLLVISNIFILVACHASENKPSNCEGVKLQVLGSGGPEIDDGLASSSTLIWINNKAKILVDAGGGSSLNFEKSGAKFNDLSAVLLTHLHVDHSVALPVYIKAGYFSGRESQLPIFGPNKGGDFPSTNTFLTALLDDRTEGELNSVYPYLSDNIYKQASTDFLVKGLSYPKNKKHWVTQINHDLTITGVKVNHGEIPALAWRVDYKNCSISFSGDMNGSSGNLDGLAKNSDWLVANNAIPEDAGRIAKFLHMTPSQIGKTASNAKVKNLVLSHFMNRTKNKKNESVKIIRQEYKGNIYLSDDLKIFDL